MTRSSPTLARLGRGRLRLLAFNALALALFGCGRAEPAPEAQTPPVNEEVASSPTSAVGLPTQRPTGPTQQSPSPTPQLVDSAMAPAVAGEGGWMYQQSASSDLDGDGQVERMVLTAQAEVMNGRPLWDDGQPWQVYVEEADGTRTYLYARFVQLGMVTARLTTDTPGRGVTVLLLEHLPDRLALIEIDYEAPGRSSVLEYFERSLDPRGELASPRLP